MKHHLTYYSCSILCVFVHLWCAEGKLVVGGRPCEAGDGLSHAPVVLDQQLLGQLKAVQDTILRWARTHCTLHIHMYVCTYCTHTLHIHMYVRMHIHTHCTYTLRMHIHMYIRMHIHTTYAHTHYVCTYTHTYAHTHIHMYAQNTTVINRYSIHHQLVMQCMSSVHAPMCVAVL